MSLEYQRYGNGAAFVYVCGIEGSGKLFYKQIDDLARDHTVLTMPLRPRGRYAMKDLIEDLRFVVRDAGFERATIWGESFGGMIVMSAALAHPEIFERMILVNAFPYFENRRKIESGVALFSLFPSLLKFYRRRDSHRSVCHDDVLNEDRLRYGEMTKDASITGCEGYVSRMRIIRDTDLRSHLHEIKIPTLVVAGLADHFLDSLTSAKLIASKLPRAKLKLLEDVGHIPVLSKDVRVRDWLAEFDSM